MADFRLFHQMLSRVRFVLVSPSHPGNVGASARAMQAMGFRHLWLSSPEDPKIAQRSDAVALSSGAAQVLGDSRVASLADALGPVTWSCALSARIREFEPPRMTLEQACESLLDHLGQDASREAAFVFGAERYGLTNDQLLSCRHVCSLDVEEKFSSLNLSQAVQVVAYAVRRAARTRQQMAEGNSAATAGIATDIKTGTPEAALDHVLGLAMGSAANNLEVRSGNNRETSKPATHEAVAGLYEHLVRVAIRVGYLDPKVPGRFDDRIKRLLARKDMLEDEVQMLRGLCTEIERRT